uniref:Sodium/potassium-transporting ATPase subunit beta-3 n=2 Tax=Phallusia mammillata TaxID=59560 RepID=A0A6F9D7Y6_9ASCI|nr:sodium/potassium-transporting ATPase subunit beta-3 [Phallusia mammillata]
MFYYSFLAALFAASISIVLSTLSNDIPRFQTRLQTPGMSIQPRLNSRQSLSSDIKYTVSNADSRNVFVNQYEKFLYPYAAVNQTKAKNCTNQKPGVPSTFTGDNINTPCFFDKNSLGPCAVKPYGYDVGKPCILVKVNKIINWFPVGFTNLDNAVAASDSKAPPLRDVLTTRGVVYDPLIMYVACYGRKEADMVNLNGDTNQVSSATAYYPRSGGIEFKYYPYYGNNRDPNYRVPLVAVQFNNVTVSWPCFCPLLKLGIFDSI